MPPSISLIGRGNRQTGIQFHNGGEGGSGRLIIILVVVQRSTLVHCIRIDIRIGTIRSTNLGCRHGRWAVDTSTAAPRAIERIVPMDWIVELLRIATASISMVGWRPSSFEVLVASFS